MDRFKEDSLRFGYVDDNLNLVVTHDSGFFSCCTVRLRKIIFYYNKYGKIPIVNSSAQWSKYKDRDEDITHILFDTADIDFKNIHKIKFSLDTREDQFSDYSKINFNDISFFIKKYFKVSNYIDDIEKQILNKYKIDVNKTIAICYRGSDKRTETEVPSYDEMIDRIHYIKRQNPDHSILLQTDEIEFLNTIRSHIPDIILIDETFKVTCNSRAVQFYIPAGQRLTNAMIFLAVMQILSKCNHVILNSGNVGLWICLFRNSTYNISQYLNNTWL